MNWQELLQDLINLVETTAPHLWKIAIRQVYVNALQNIICALALIIAAFFLYKIGKTSWSYHLKNEYDLFDLCAGLANAAMAIAIVLSVGFACAAIGRLINPEYYAIELLTNYIK